MTKAERTSVDQHPKPGSASNTRTLLIRQEPRNRRSAIMLIWPPIEPAGRGVPVAFTRAPTSIQESCNCGRAAGSASPASLTRVGRRARSRLSPRHPGPGVLRSLRPKRDGHLGRSGFPAGSSGSSRRQHPKLGGVTNRSDPALCPGRMYSDSADSGVRGYPATSHWHKES